MELLTTEFIMRNARVEYPDTIQKYADSAEMYVAEIAGKTFDEIRTEYGNIPVEFAMVSLIVADKLLQYGEPNPYTGMCLPLYGFKLPYAAQYLIKKYSKPGIEKRIEDIENRIKGVISARRELDDFQKGLDCLKKAMEEGDKKTVMNMLFP